MSEDKHASSSANTAYQYDARTVTAGDVDSNFGWAPPINNLLAQRHQFLPIDFGPGVLFRALPPAWTSLCDAQGLGLLHTDSGVSSQESELGVMLMSHELSDALAIARLWEPAHADAVILVIHAERFSERLQQRQAGVLAFAEPGVVFRYPFVVPPLRAEEVHCLICPTGSTASINGVEALRIGEDTRENTGQQILTHLDDHNRAPAAPVRTKLYPTRGRSLP